MLIGDILTNNARHFPDKPGIVDEHGPRLTWNQVNARVNRLANALLGLGLARNDRVAILAENSHQYVEFQFAVAKAGLIGVGLNYRLLPKQLESIVDDCQPKAILVQSKFAGIVDEMREHSKSIGVYVGMDKGHGYPLDFETLVKEHSPAEPEVEIGEDDTPIICYSTGTTGSPKGVALTHRMRIHCATIENILWRYVPQDVVLIGLPLLAWGGQIRFFPPCLAGCTVVIHIFGGKSFVDMVEKEKVTCTTLAPTRYQLVRDYLDAADRAYDLGSLQKVAIGGGQRSTPEQVREIVDFCRVSHSFTSYSMTEGAYTALPPEDVAAGLSPQASPDEWNRLGSVGRPWLDGKMRIVDDNDQDLPPGEIGEIVVKGDTVMSGYWNRPDLTSKVIRDGWFHTSDLGKLDEKGCLFFQGRKDFMIKSGGLFVAPQEVENAIMQHPAVAEAAVIGIPDEKWGQAVKAVVSLKEGQAVTEDDLRAHCRNHLAGFQVPKSVSFVSQLPRESEMGKIQVKELMRIYSGT